MKQSEYLSKSFINALGTFLYIALVALFLSHAESFFGNGKSLLIPIFILLIFIISASITSLLVLGKPIQMYLDGHKMEGIKLLIATLSWLVIFAACVAFGLVSR